MSVWSLQIDQPGAIARLTLLSTIGSRAPTAQCSISCISASPWPLVAV